MPRKRSSRPRPFPWRNTRLNRAQRVIAFLEFLPITKGILRDKRMVLLPHQRDFVERVYADGDVVRLAISSIARGNGKKDWLRVWSLLT